MEGGRQRYELQACKFMRARARAHTHTHTHTHTQVIRERDAAEGTSVWKNMTAHTVPKWLRPLGEYNAIESDHEVYTKLERSRRIVLNPSFASTAPREELQSLQAFFAEKGMVPHVQKILQRSGGLKPLLLLGTIGGGKHVWRGEEHWNPFGKTRSAGGPRESDPELVASGCRMLMGVARNHAGIRFRFVRAGLMQQLVRMGLVVLKGGHVDALWATMEALAFFSHARNEEASDIKPRVLREGGLELIIGCLRQHPLHFGVKRECLEWALGMITGRNSRWKVVLCVCVCVCVLE